MEINNRSKKVTVKTISELTGYSTSTVSLVLNNKGIIKEDTRKAIFEAAETLNYGKGTVVQNKYVRLLIEESSSSVFSDPFNGEIIRGIEYQSSAMGYQVLITFLREDTVIESLIEGVSGMLILGGGLVVDERINCLNEAQIPVVLVDNYSHEAAFTCVYADHYGAGYLAAKYLIDKGHQKIGFISGPKQYKTLTDRFAGYCSALVEHGVSIDMKYVSPNFSNQPVKGYLEAKYLFSLPDYPKAIFAVSDKAAMGVITRMDEIGLVLGKDIDLVSCDNIDAPQLRRHRLPTVNIPKFEVGQQAITTLIGAIEGNSFYGKIVIPVRMVEPGEITE